MLPHPLAALYQLVFVSHRPSERYAYFLRLAEGMLRCLAYLALADAASCGVPTDKYGRWLLKLRMPGCGKLQAVLGSATSYLAQQPGSFIPELRTLFTDQWKESVGRIIDERNRFAHVSYGLPDRAAQRRLEDLKSDLRILLANIQFLRHYRLGTLHQQRQDEEAGFVSHWRGCRGQEEECPAVTLRCATALPEQTALLLDIRRDRALVVSPFFHRVIEHRRGFFVWLDRLDAGRCVYRHSVLDLERRRALPDPSNPDGDGVSKDDYLARLHDWHRPLDLGLGAESLAALAGTTSPSSVEDQYEVIGKLGEGAMGTVWEVRNVTLRRRVALKILRREHLPSESQVKRFQREAALLSRMSHPGIVKVNTLGVGRGGEPFIEMDLLEGESLEARIARTGAIPVSEAIDLAIRVLEALDYIHRQGVIHRDLKPSNVILCRDGPKLVDFGIASVLDGTKLTATMSVMGTLNFMAPEQWSGEADARSDLYAMGRTLYQMLSGGPPVGLDPELSEIPDVPSFLVGVYETATAMRPDDRYPSARKMRAALQGVALASERQAAVEDSVSIGSGSPPTPGSGSAPVGRQDAGEPVVDATRTRRRSRGERLPRFGAPGGLLPWVAGLVLLAIAGVALHQALWPRFTDVTLRETRRGQHQLLLEGENLATLQGIWVSRWLDALEQEGVHAERRSGLEAEVDGRLATIPVELAQRFSTAWLPLPQLATSDSQPTARVRHEARLRLLAITYTQSDVPRNAKAFDRLHAALVDWVRRERPDLDLHPTLVLEHRSASFLGSQSPEAIQRELAPFDLIHASGYVYIYLKWLLSRGQVDPAETPALEWVGCNIGANDLSVYSSVLFTPLGSTLDEWLPEGQTLTPHLLDRFIDEVAGPDGELEVHYGNELSTSGKVIPCLRWGEHFARPEVRIVHNTDHDATVDQVIGRPLGPAEHRLGAAYKEVLDAAIGEGGRHQGRGYRRLWERRGIPHGGLLMRTSLPLAEQEVIRTGLESIFQGIVSGELPLKWPPMGDLRGIGTCDIRKFSELEADILGHPAVEECAFQLDPAEAGTTTSALAQSRGATVRVGGYVFPPFVEQEPAGRWRGLTLDLIDALNEAQSAWTFEFVPTTASGRYSDHEAGAFDLLFFESKTWGWTDRPVSPSHTYLRGGEVYVALQRPGRDQRWFDSVAGHKLAVVRGYHYGFASMEADPDTLSERFDVEFADAPQGALDLVLDGRAEVAVVTRAWLLQLLQDEPGLEQLLLVSEQLDQVYNHTVLVGEGTALSASDVDDLLDSLRSSGTLDGLLAPYGLSGR